jgi:hypothetical protein
MTDRKNYLIVNAMLDNSQRVEVVKNSPQLSLR